MAAPVLVNPIPAQVVNEQAAFGPFDLKQFIQVAEGSAPARFQGELSDGQALPKGLICTEDGIITGIPAKDTHGNYEILITAQNEEGSAQANFILTIKPSLSSSASEYADQIKAQVWQALGQNLPLPDLGEMYERPITMEDIYYLVERWGLLTMWDAFNLEPPGEKHLLTLEGVSPHYNVYDRGSCLVGCPKDLFSYERTIEDGLQTARAMAREVYKRNWTIEMAGLNKMMRAAWVEIQRLGDKYGKQLEVINFTPNSEDIKAYTTQVKMRGMD
ncbi:Ig domain-containing protein [Aquicella lusitana]|uniref:Uncharacterized protein n=1 Tax=Aquicella lusitana TaxID=254246 RepID=A0A370GYJ9_9COXI|nr:Ig domain-containing protein [Aquicella lusitana]RDI46933.1 hypothetical protein C8D86_10456 [Aquicella lusitana]VVC73824.1 hypothetical protein AQULUS_15740 [Aquicella lusitana]